MLNNVRKMIIFFGLKSFALRLLLLIARVKRNWTVVRNGLTYELDIGKTIDFGIFAGGWERDTCEFLRSELTQGNQVIEVGANIGAHTLLISTLVGSSGKVVAVEPTKYASGKLKKNISLNRNLENITVIEKIISNTNEGLTDIEINSDWGIFDDTSPEKLNVESITIDSIIAQHSFDRLDLIKIDVDGFELKVLQSAVETLDRLKPTIYIELCEYALKKQDASVTQIFEFLGRRDYLCYHSVTRENLTSEKVLKLVGDDTSINAIFQKRY